RRNSLANAPARGDNRHRRQFPNQRCTMASDGSSPAERGPGYEFTPDQNKVIGDTASKMKRVGRILLVFGLINLVQAIMLQVVFHQIKTESLDVELKDKLVS